MRQRQSLPIDGGPTLVFYDAERGGALLKWDVSGSFSERSLFDDRAKGFTYLSIDPLPFKIYIKRSNAVGDWSDGQEIKASPAQSTEDAQRYASDAAASAILADQRANVSVSASNVASAAAVSAGQDAALTADDRVQTGLDRQRTGVDRAVATNEANRAAASAVSAAQVAPNRTYDELIADTSPAVGTVRQVLTGPNSGVYELKLVGGVKTWVRVGDTFPGLADSVLAEVTARQALIRTGEVWVAGFGVPDDTYLDANGRVISLRKGLVWHDATEKGLIPRAYVADVHVPGFGLVNSATISSDRRVGYFHRDDLWYDATPSGFVARQHVVDVFVPGFGLVDNVTIGSDRRVKCFNKDGVWYDATTSGFVARQYAAEVYIPGLGFAEVAIIGSDGRVSYAEVGGTSYRAFGVRGLVATAGPTSRDVDYLIYGATLGGLMAAERCAPSGARIGIFEPTGQTGGVISNGLTYTDTPMYGQTALIGGLTRQVFVDVANEYGRGPAPMWLFEPKIFDIVFNRRLGATGARVTKNSPIEAASDIIVRNGVIEAIRMSNGWISCAVASDTSYEGDIIRHSGAPWRVGREAASEYGEPNAGFRTSWGYSRSNVIPNDGYPTEPRPPLAEGDADDSINPYSFRTILTNAPDRIPFFAPDGVYDTNLMVMVRAIVAATGSLNFEDYVSLPVVSLASAAYVKACINAPRLVGIELPGRQLTYPTGDWAERRRVVDEHRHWTLNFLYCLANDPAIPEALRIDAQKWGFPRDEFVNCEIPGFPDWLYVREAIRLRGAYVMTEFDMWDASNPLNTSGTRNSVKADKIARWAYFKDAHGMRLYPEGANTIRSTGNSNLATHDVDPYDIPFRVLYTDPSVAGHIKNLLVSLDMSFTSVGWRSGRMEPVFGMCSEAAGEAAALMLDLGVTVDQVPYALLASRLRARGSNI